MCKKNQILLPAILLLFLAQSGMLSQDQKADRPVQAITLKECIANALASNLDLSIEAFNPVINEALISESKEQYLPEFKMSYFKQNQTILGGWGVEGTSYPFKMDSYSFDLTQRVVTGGSATLSFSNSMTDTGRAYQVINPSYTSLFQLTLTQPLLKGFGPKINRIASLRAIVTRDISIAELKSKLIQIVYEVEGAYWNLYSAIENMKVQENSLEESLAILKRNQEAVRIGAKSAIDVLSSEAEVAQYEDSLVSARLAVEQSEAGLKKILNLPSEAPDSGLFFIPSDRPVIEKKDIAYEEAFKVALEQRPEMTQSEKELERNANDISYYRNQLLPQLDMTFSTWSPGQSGIKYIYLNNNPFTGVIINKIEGSRMDALKEAFKRTYKNWSVNLNLTLPLANFFSRSSLARSKLEQEQSVQRMEKQKQTIAYEVAGAIQNLQNAERKIKSSAASRELQEKRLAAEMQRYQLGLGSIEWLLSYQRSLTSAKTSEIQAQIDYKIAVADLERIMGTSLRLKRLKFRDYEFWKNP